MFAIFINFNHTAVHNHECLINPVIHYLYISLQALRRTGLLTSDPRLRDCVDQMRQSTQDSTGPVMMDMALFRKWEKLSLFMKTQSCIPLLQWEYLTLTCTYMHTRHPSLQGCSWKSTNLAELQSLTNADSKAPCCCQNSITFSWTEEGYTAWLSVSNFIGSVYLSSLSEICKGIFSWQTHRTSL